MAVGNGLSGNVIGSALKTYWLKKIHRTLNTHLMRKQQQELKNRAMTPTG
jgi:hypothetical protein